MLRFRSLGWFAITPLLLVAFVVKAQNASLDSDKVLLTITNKSDSELLVHLRLHPVHAQPTFSPSPHGSSPTPAAPLARNSITEFTLGQIVQPQQQVILQIPKGKYLVQANPPHPTPSAIRRTLRISPSHDLNDDVATNEV